MSRLARASAVFGSMTMLSRIAGLVRDWLQATSPAEIPGLQPFMTPNPRELPHVRLAAISASDIDKEFQDAHR